MNCPYVMRRCKKCGEVKFLFKFIKNKKSKYGFEKQCSQCRKQYGKQYREGHKEEIVEKKKQYYQRNKEERLEYVKQYYQRNKEEKKQYAKQYREGHKEEKKQYAKQYREGHKEERLEYDKQYYQKNKEEKLKKHKRYRQTPQGQVVHFNCRNRRRSKEKNQGNGIDAEQWLEMMNFFNWECAYSNIYIGGNENQSIRSVDHIIALDNGGLNEIWNCVPMYRHYNSSKKTSDMLVWYQQQDFYSEERLQKIYEWQEYAYNKWGKEGEVCLH